jgi:5-methylcytosine-specific restriction endonuclease McrA
MLTDDIRRQVIVVLAGIGDLHDDRLEPDNRRRGQFKAGWADATTRGQTYSETALAQITWNNLGYRMGKAIGPAADELILEIFGELAELYGTADEAEIFGLAMEDDESDENEDEEQLPGDEEFDEAGLEEGKLVVVVTNRYERSAAARMACLAHHGHACSVCGFDYATAFPGIPEAEGFIHVHHIVPLSSIGESYVVNPVTDLVPLCPNCHAAVHMRSPPFAVAELRSLKV